MADFNLGSITEKRKITGGSGTCEVEFCPTDPFFLQRIEEACKQIDELRGIYSGELSKDGQNVDAYFEFDRRVKSVIDHLFNAPVCDTAFHDQYMFGLYHDVPLWLQLVLWALDETYTAADDDAGQRMVAKIKRYENKYTKKYHK